LWIVQAVQNVQAVQIVEIGSGSGRVLNIPLKTAIAKQLGADNQDSGLFGFCSPNVLNGGQRLNGLNDLNS
jgi:hypothetical protein